MIEVYYYYKRKNESKWIEGTQIFDDVKKALRFIKKTDSREDMNVWGWWCQGPEDNEYLYARHHIVWKL